MHRFSAKRFSCEKKRIHRLYDSLVCHTMPFYIHSILDLYSLSGKTSYRQISWSLEAARLDVAMVISLWNLTATSAAVLPRYLPNFRAIGRVSTRISRLRDFARSCGKASYGLVNRGPDLSTYFALRLCCGLVPCNFTHNFQGCFSGIRETMRFS